MLLRDHIDEDQSQKQISATLKITEQTLFILSNLQDELNKLKQKPLEYLQMLIVIQISDLRNKQKQFNSFLNEHDKINSNIVGVQSNELLQLNISIRLQLKGELQNCGTFINNDFLNRLYQELNKSDEINGKEERKYKYRKLLSFKMKLLYCLTFVFNTSSTVIFSGYQDGKIRVNGFNSIYKLIQTFSDKKFQKELIWIKKSNQLVVGCEDQSIVIWENYWNSYQKLKGHTDTISCLILNQKEDLLISGSHDKTIKFWKNINSIWTLKQTIDVQFKLYCLSINNSEKKLISCGDSSDITILEFLQQNWVITQQISVEKYGLYLGFVNNNSFIFQPLAQQFLQIYNFQMDEQKFVKVKQIQFICGPEFNASFKFKILQEKSLIVVKHQDYVIVIKYNQNWDHYIQQVIDFHDFYLWGNITGNGQFLVTWNLITQENKVWTLKLM